MSARETVCAVVVTFNRKQLLLECLEGLRRQTRSLEAIYIIDNFSNDGTPELLLNAGIIAELPPASLQEPWESTLSIQNVADGSPLVVHYVRMHENTGGAGGFHEGVKRAYEKGYDWLWLMDDDVEPLEDGLSNMLSYKTISQCIHPSKKFLNGDRFFWEGYISEETGRIIYKKDEFIGKKQFTAVNYGCFEGMLIARSIVEKIGYPIKELFFIGDDTLYGYAASQYTNPIYIADVCMVKKINKKGSKPSPLTDYLSIRNTYFVINNVARKKIFANFLFVISVLKLLILRTLAYKDYKLLKAILTGYKDGIFGIWGGEKNFLQNSG